MNSVGTAHNGEKSTTRVNINSAMIGVIFTILTLVWTLNPTRFNAFTIYQLVIAIPLLFISSLAYTKIGYRSNNLLFDRFAWVTTTLGNNLVLNTAALIAGNFYKPLGYIYLIIMALGVTVYYIMNILSGSRPRNQLIKLAVVFAIIFLGGFLPLILYY